MNYIRKKIRQKRKRLNRFEQAQAQKQVFFHIIKTPIFKTAQKIGLYLSAFGEINTHLIILHCFKLGKKVYLPKIHSINQKLVWVNISQHQYLQQQFYTHQLGMKEPHGRGIDVSKIDLLIMPLVACDSLGTRLGMGGGFYDRTLCTAPIKPYRFGIAHDFQLLPNVIFRQKWDQPLNALCTPKRLIFFKRLP